MVSRRQLLLAPTVLTGAATTNSEAMDIMNYTVAAVQIVVAAGGTLAGTFKVQASNDGLSWFDLPLVTAALSTTSPILFNLGEIGAAFIRGVIISSSGTSTCSIVAIAKE
jgi:hypothetical protein